MPAAIPLRQQTLRFYGEIVARMEDAAGKLVFSCGAGVSDMGLAEAASVAGATSLLLDPDRAATRRVLRRGGVDFVVNTLDEALRVLKNEIRQKRPLGVALFADVDQVLEEMRERGVLPDLYIKPEAFRRGFRAQGPGPRGLAGVRSVVLGLVGGEIVPSLELAAWLQERGWREGELPAGDEVFVADAVRARWAEGIERYQRLEKGAARFGWIGGF